MAAFTGLQGMSSWRTDAGLFTEIRYIHGYGSELKPADPAALQVL